MKPVLGLRSLHGKVIGSVKTMNESCSSTCDTVTPGQLDDSFMVFTDPITFPCKDLNPRTGFIQIPTCATWGNSANEVGPNLGSGACGGATDVFPGTGSKCNCSVIQSNVPN